MNIQLFEIKKINIMFENKLHISFNVDGLKNIDAKLLDISEVKIKDENRTVRGLIEEIKRDQNFNKWVSGFSLRKTDYLFIPLLDKEVKQ